MSFVLVLSSTAGLVLSQAPYDLGAIAIISLVPWLIAIKRGTSTEACAMSVALGMLYAVAAADWMFGAFEAQGLRGFPGVLAVAATALWAKGLLFGAVGWCVHSLSSRPIGVQIALPSALWGCGEYWISDSVWGLPLILLGHSQHSISGVAQLAVVIGVPGISAFVFATNVAVANLLVEGNETGHGRVATAWLIAWLTAAIGGESMAHVFRGAPISDRKLLLVVQPNIPPEDRWEEERQPAILGAIVMESARAIEQSGRTPDLIVWPENLLTFPTSSGTRLGNALQDAVQRLSVPVVTGLVRPSLGTEAGRYRNSAVWLDPVLGVRDAVDKVRAIPILESGRQFWGRRGLERLMGAAASGPRVTEAEVGRPLNGEFTLSVTLCFEVLFPGVVDARRNHESLAILNLADDSWVGGEKVDAQIIAGAKFRAIEQRLALVRLSHGGLSVAIDRYGQTIASLEPDEWGHFFIEVAAAGPPRIGERVALLLLPVVGGWLSWLSWPRRRN